MSVVTSQVSPLFQARTNHATSHFCLSEGKPKRECDCRKMRVFILLIVCAALLEIVNGARQPCKVCGVLDAILKAQVRLEKTVKGYGKTLGSGRCTGGKGIVKIIMFALRM